MYRFYLQLIHPYDCTRKSFKWYRKLSFNLLQKTMLNSHILYQKKGGKKAFKEFQEDVITDLLFCNKDVFDNVDGRNMPRHSILVRLAGHHYVSIVPRSEATGRYLRLKCAVCLKKGKRQDTIYHCEYCVGSPGLCIECFKAYHTKLFYWK